MHREVVWPGERAMAMVAWVAYIHDCCMFGLCLRSLRGVHSLHSLRGVHSVHSLRGVHSVHSVHVCKNGPQKYLYKNILKKIV